MTTRRGNRNMTLSAGMSVTQDSLRGESDLARFTNLVYQSSFGTIEHAYIEHGAYRCIVGPDRRGGILSLSFAHGTREHDVITPREIVHAFGKARTAVHRAINGVAREVSKSRELWTTASKSSVKRKGPAFSILFQKGEYRANTPRDNSPSFYLAQDSRGIQVQRELARRVPQEISPTSTDEEIQRVAGEIQLDRRGAREN
nr:hypothetical protein [Candidatus Sigynarchaeota archaeon]